MALVRPGRSVELVRAKLSDADGEVIRAHAWRLRTTEVSFEEPPGRQEALPGPEQGQPGEFFHTGYDVGYHTAMELDWRSYLFINVDLGVHLHRMPTGDWVCLDAVTLPEQNGIGLADTTLHDERAPIGHALQTLLVDRRQAG
jgi:hypothetical protein